MNLITNSDMTTLLPHPQHLECMHAYMRQGRLCGEKELTKIEVADSAVAGRAAAQAPAAGRLAAAMATIWASRRPIRDGAARRNEVTCRISHFPLARERPGAYGKWALAAN
jgi:hypothetical protein